LVGGYGSYGAYGAYVNPWVGKKQKKRKLINEFITVPEEL
jgi:hypothetical protein